MAHSDLANGADLSDPPFYPRLSPPKAPIVMPPQDVAAPPLQSTADLGLVHRPVERQGNPTSASKILMEFGFRTYLDHEPSQRMVFIGNLPTLFTPSQMMLHIPAQLCLQILRVDAARCYCKECNSTGAHRTTMALELGSAQAARFLSRWLVHGSLSDLDAPQPRPIAFSESLSTTKSRAIKYIEVSLVSTLSHMVTVEDCVLIARHTTRFVGIKTLAIDCIHEVGQIALKNRVIRAHLDLASMDYRAEFPSIRAADIFFFEVTRVRKIFWPTMFANIRFESKPPRCFDPANPTIRVLPSDIYTYFESEFTILGQAGTSMQPLSPVCTPPQARGGGGNFPADIDTNAPPSPAAPPAPNPLKPHTYMTRDEFASQAAFERRIVPYEVVDVDSEVKRGIKARIRCKRVPWGHSYPMAEFNKLIELKFIDSIDPFWSAVLDEMYFSQGTINLRRLRLGREPVAANMWGILH